MGKKRTSRHKHTAPKNGMQKQDVGAHRGSQTFAWARKCRCTNVGGLSSIQPCKGGQRKVAVLKARTFKTEELSLDLYDEGTETITLNTKGHMASCPPWVSTQVA